MAKTHTLSFPIRLPDILQAEALRLLDASREAINQIIMEMWPKLDVFATDRTGPAWKQVERYLIRRSGHGNRQERNEMEQAGRLLRAQASRKRLFDALLPLLGESLIIPTTDKHPARKDYGCIKDEVRAFRAAQKDAGDEQDAFMAMTNLLEQACNHYLKGEAFPTSYAQMQDPPVLSGGCLTFAGDDGMKLGQTYRARIDPVSYCDLSTREVHHGATLALRLRTPDEQGRWRWGTWCDAITLPKTVSGYLAQAAELQAPTLREIRGGEGERVAVLDLTLEVPARLVPNLSQERRVLGFDWGIRSLITISILEVPEDFRERPDQPFQQISRPLFLDTGGLDGRQARLRREIDRLKACKQHYEQHIKAAVKANREKGTPFPTHYEGWISRVRSYEERIVLCWKKYERRNQELAHLASNLLILFSLLYDCHLICGENLSTLKTIGRGRGVRGRFRNWRNNSQVRGGLWCVLKYKCYLLGIRTRLVEPRGTTHTCPRCHRGAKTFASPATRDRKKAIDWGAYLCCDHPACLWSGARDYAASLNIARLGLTFLRTYLTTSRYTSYRMTSNEVNSCSYMGQEALLLLPAQGITPCPLVGKYMYYAGWSYATSLRTSYPRNLLAILSTSQLRKYVLKRASC